MATDKAGGGVGVGMAGGGLTWQWRGWSGGQGVPANGKKSLEATENFFMPRRASAVTVSAWIGNEIGLSSPWFRAGFLGQLCTFLMLLAALALRLGDLNPPRAHPIRCSWWFKHMKQL